MNLCNRCRQEFFERPLDDDGFCEECRLIVDGHMKEEGVLPLEEQDAPERFREFFDVTQVLAPTPRYTDGFFTSFTDEQSASLDKLVVPYKPSIGVK